MVRYCLYVIAKFFSNFLPLISVYRIAEALADFHYFLASQDRRAVTANMTRICRVSKADPDMVREVFRNFARYLAEFFTMRKLTVGPDWKDRFRVEGLEYLGQALARGKGGILLTAHFGNWELGGVVMGKLGYPVLAVALPHNKHLVNEWFNRQRRDNGVGVIPPSLALRKCLEHLKENKLVAIVADRSFSNSGVVVEFMGERTLFPKGPVAFASRTGAAIIPSFMVREGYGKFHLIIGKPLYPDELGLTNNDPDKWTDIVQGYARDIEAMVRANPTQWLMFREFWIK